MNTLQVRLAQATLGKYIKLNKMKILTGVLCCDFKEYSLDQCLANIKKAGFNDILLNYEGTIKKDYGVTATQEWNFNQNPPTKRQADQDQGYRLPRIVAARNMVLDYAMIGQYDWIFFVDSDVMIPTNTRQELFEGNTYKLKSGLVPGRGPHAHARYLFEPEAIVNGWTPCKNATCGFTGIHKDLFRTIRFRWGNTLGHFDGSEFISEDPLYGMDCRKIYGEKWWVKQSLRASHIGDFQKC